MVTRLVGIRREKRDAGFLRRNRKILPFSPCGDFHKVTIKLLVNVVKIDAGFQDRKIVRIAESQLGAIGEISNEEIEEYGRNYAALRYPVVDLFEGRSDRVINTWKPIS